MFITSEKEYNKVAIKYHNAPAQPDQAERPALLFFYGYFSDKN